MINERLLLQLLITILPVFIYEILFNHKHFLQQRVTSKKVVITTLCGVSIIVCMSFPIKLFYEYLFDLREVPWLIGILYGGFRVGAALTILLIGYRSFLGGDGVFIASLLHVVMIPLVFYFVSKYKGYDSKDRMKTAMLLVVYLSFFGSILAVVWLKQISNLPITRQNLLFFFVLAIFNAAGIFLTVYLIEKERSRIKMIYELQEAEKLRLLSHLAASIAHEIRNPLTVIRGFLQMFAKNELEPQNLQKYTPIMINELDRAQGIISDYLTFARPETEPQRLETLDVKQQILNTVNIMNTYANKHNVQIEVTLQDHLYIKAEKNKFSQVLINLIKNSIEAMTESGKIEIACSKRNQYVAIEVIDQGIGMDKQQLERLGNPFYSTKEKGTGLGLMVSYRIIHSLNGNIQVFSEPGKGAHFYITIPVESVQVVKADLSLDA